MSSIPYAMFPPEDDKDALFNPAMSCYLLMTAAAVFALGATGTDL